MKRVISIIAAFIIILTLSINIYSFNDTTSHWAKDYIEQLTDLEVIKGKGDGLFHPEDTITKAEFTAILLRAIGNDIGQPDSGKWYELYIEEAKDKRYILAGEFDSVESNITRGEMARMITRALDESYADNINDYTSQIADYKDIPGEYQDYVLKAFVKGIITGRPGGVFAYSDTATRAEASTMIVRLIDEDKRIVPELTKKAEKPEKSEKSSSEGLYLYEHNEEKEVKIQTDYPELIPHIKKSIEILDNGEGYLDAVYKKNINEIELTLYKHEETLNLDKQQRHTLLDLFIYTEPYSSDDTTDTTYLAYSTSLYDIHNELAAEKFKKIIKDVYPEAYEKVVSELENKINNNDYENKLFEEVDGKGIQIFTFKGIEQVDVCIIFENKEDLQ